MPTDEPTPAALQGGPPALPTAQPKRARGTLAEFEETTNPELSQLASDNQELATACAEELDGQPEPARAARLHVELARIWEWTDELASAAEHYDHALAAQPDCLPAIQGARRIHLLRKRYRSAVPLFDAEARVTGEAKRRAMLFLEKGRLLEDRLSDATAARQAYERALELDPQNASILKALERSAAAARRPDQLAEAFERAANAVAEDPVHRAGLLVQRAHLLWQAGDSDTAADIFETALNLDDTAHGALEALEHIYLAEQEWQRLIGVLERMAQGTRDHALRALLLYRVAHVHADRLGNLNEAIDALARAARAAPRDLLVLEDLAHLYADREMFVSLLNVQRALVEASPEGAERVALLHGTGVLYDLLGRDDEATTYLRAALESDPTHVPALQALGKLYGRRERWEELIAMHLAEATATDDLERAAAAHARIAEILEVRLSRPADAAEHHTRALSLVPGYPASFKALTRLYAESGQHRHLVRLYERAADRTEDMARKIAHLFKVGSLWEDQLEDAAQAAHAYRSILDVDPVNLGALHALQRVLERARRWKQLVRALEREAELTDEAEIKVGLLHRAGTVLDEYLSDRDAACARFNAVLELAPSFVPALASLGRIYYRTGRWDELLDMYQRELAVTPPGLRSATLLHKMGELAEQSLGDVERAIACYRQAAEMDPSYRPALRALARLLRARADWRGLATTLELELEGQRNPGARALALFRCGEVHEEHLSDPERALYCYERALEENPRHRPAALALARLRAVRGEWQQLAREIDREIPATTDQTRAVSMLLQQGELLRDRLGDAAGAVRCFRAAAEHESGRLPALLALEQLYQSSQAWTELARIYAEQAQTLTDEGARIAALRELARLQELHGIGDSTQLAATYRSILSHAAGDEAALCALERIGRETSDRELLVEVYRTLGTSATDPSAVAEYCIRLGQLLEDKQDMGAIDAYQRAVAADAQAMAAIRGLARVATYLNDTRGMADAARREAAIVPDRRRAARLWLRSGTLRLELGDDPAEAIADLEQALESWPDEEQAATRLIEPLIKSGRVERLVDLLSRAARSAVTPERKTGLWMSVADLCAHHVGDLGMGVAALQRAIEVTPRSVAAHRNLAALHAGGKQWNAAIESYERALSCSQDPEEVCRLHLELADIRGGKLGDHAAALEHVTAVLELAPQSPAALKRLADLQLERGDGEGAAETARSLTKVSPDPQERARALVHLARIERARGQQTAAEDALTEALALQGPGGEAAEFFGELAREHGSWVGYAAGLAAHLQRAAKSEVPYAGGRGPAIAFLGLSQVYADGMGLPKKAIETLEEGLKITSGDAVVRLELALRLRAARDYDAALAHLHGLLVSDPTRAPLWEELARTFEEADRPAEAVLALAPLELLGDGAVVHAVTRRLRPASAPPGSFDSEALSAISVNGAGAAVATDLLAALADAVGKLYTVDLGRLGVSKDRRIDSRSDHPLGPLGDRVIDIFAATCELYEHPAPTPLVSVEMTETPSVLISESVRTMPTAQQAFLLAFAVAQVATRTYPAAKIPAEELRLLLLAAARSAVPDFGRGAARPGEEEVLESLTQRLRRAVPRRWRRPLEVAAAEYAAAPPPEVRTWQKALRQSALRAATLVADDLSASVQALRRLEGLNEVDGAALIKSSPAIADLLYFWVSEPALRVRRSFGVL